MAATTATATAAIISITKIPKTQIQNHFITHFTLTMKPFKALSLKHIHHFHALPLSLLVRPSASSDPITETNPFSDTEKEEEGFEESYDDGDKDDEDDDERERETGEAGRLYVGNLPYAMASAQLSEVFVEAGRVVSVEIVYDRVTDRSRGFAFVTMSSMKEAKEAIRMFDGSQIGGRTVKVNFPEVPRGGEREVMGPKIRSNNQSFIDSPHKIYAGNLGWALTSQGLRDAFFDQPGLLSAKVVYDRATGRSRGFGFVTFSSEEALESALNTMNGVELEGRPLRLSKAEQRAPTIPRSRNDLESNLQSREVFSGFGN